MLCQRCNKNVATTILTTTINGKTTTEHICSECAYQTEMKNFFTPFSLSSIFSEIANPVSYGYKRCEKCGSSFEEIMETSKIGCAYCYTAFKNELMPTIQNIHGKARHIGKVPKGQKARLPEKANLISPMEELRKKLQTAIDNQEFENAAKIRDEMKELESKEGDNNE